MCVEMKIENEKQKDANKGELKEIIERKERMKEN